MLDPSALSDLEELTLCGVCKQKYNDADQCPKYLSCKHYFCLRCIENNLLKGRDLFCTHCWKKTDLGDQGPDSLPTNLPLLALANNFCQLKLTNNGNSKQVDKERKSENCHTHGMPYALWCCTCCTVLCRACATSQEHSGHQIKSQIDAKEQLITDIQHELVSMSKLSSEIQRLAIQQREFLIKILEACITLKTHVETDLQNGWTHLPEISDAREILGKAKANLQLIESPSEIWNLQGQLALDKQRLQAKYQEMMLQCQLDDLIGNSGVVFDFGLLKQALASIHSGESITTLGNGRAANNSAASQNPILFLANYCMSQLYSRHVVSRQQHMQNGSIEYHNTNIVTPPSTLHLHQGTGQSIQQNSQQQQLLVQPGSPSINKSNSSTGPSMGIGYPSQQNSFMPEGVGPLVLHSPSQLTPNSITSSLRGPGNPYPTYYFNIEVNSTPHGRIVIEVRPDVAPKMCKNFSVLATGEIGYGYKGCTIFQCWEGESVITGDFELNNGRGGRSIYDEGFFMPDETKFPAVRGAVGMRRTQKRHDNMGMVGSQFRIILQEMRVFTAIFGHVVEGIELIEKISAYGDQSGKPTKNIVIAKSGKL